MSDETVLHAERKNRTVICTVMFADIVKFSERGVADQIAIKDDFNSIVADAVRNIAPADRLLLDTGDGLALCLFGDPEEGMFLALTLRDAFNSARPIGVPDYLVRLGLNLGPIKVVTDLNSRFNAIGDGINVAQRVMNFAEPGQVLCSRSYYEIVSRLSDDFSRLFEYCGIRHDKHVREHDIYEVRSPLSPGGTSYDLPAQSVSEVVALKSSFPEETLQLLSSMLAKFEGPVAKLIVKKAATRSQSVEGLIDDIAQQITDPKDAVKFRSSAQGIVKELS